MSVAVDAQFASGAVVVDTSDVEGSPVVTLAPPSPRVALHPDEARRLAAAFIEQAARAITNEADTWL